MRNQSTKKTTTHTMPPPVDCSASPRPSTYYRTCSTTRSLTVCVALLCMWLLFSFYTSPLPAAATADTQPVPQPAAVALDSATTVSEKELHGRGIAEQCSQPFLDLYHQVYNALLAARPTHTTQERKSTANESRKVFDPIKHNDAHTFRRFLDNWVNETRSHHSSDGAAPDVRFLVIGDSVMRNTFNRMLEQMVKEGLAESDDYMTMNGSYQALCLTWPSRTGAAANSTLETRTAQQSKLLIRFDYQPYFSSDNHDINDSGAAAFDPTHIVVDRGLWDVVLSSGHDPLWSLAGFSAGLVKLRQRLLLNRMKKAMKGDTLRLPATRIVYFGMTKIYGPDEGADIKNKEKQCTLGKDVGPFRDALYCAVRRANGALAMIHEQGAQSVCREMVRVISTNDKSGDDAALQVCQEHLNNFSNLAIELFDAYAPTLAASVTETPDGYHPEAPLSDFLIGEIFNRLQRPPLAFAKSKASLEANLLQKCRHPTNVSRVTCGVALGLSSQMYVPPPMVLGNDVTNKSSVTCGLLAMSPADVAKLWNSSFGSAVEPPPLVSSSLRASFKSQLKCSLSHDGPAVFSTASTIRTSVGFANTGKNPGEPWQYTWRTLLQHCLFFNHQWYKNHGSFGIWAPSTLKERTEQDAYQSFVNLDHLGLHSALDRDTVHDAGRFCAEMLSQLTADDFREIWDLATNGSMPCHKAAVASASLLPPGVRHFDVAPQVAARCINLEHGRKKS